MKKISITKKISIATIGLIAMLALLAAPVYATEPGAKTATDSQRSGMTSTSASQQDVIQASSLMDRDVQDAQGNKIGSVADMMIGQDGNIEYIVLSQKDGFLGMGKKNLVPVPWSKVNARDIGDDQKALTVSVSKQQLENAPSFNNDEWKAFLRADKQQEVRGFYGTEDARPSGQEPRGYYETEGASPSGQDQMMKDKTRDQDKLMKDKPGQDSTPGQEPRGYYETEGASPSGQDQMMKDKTRDQDKLMKDKPVQDSTIKTPNYDEKRNETQRKGADGNF